MNVAKHAIIVEMRLELLTKLCPSVPRRVADTPYKRAVRKTLIRDLVLLGARRENIRQALGKPWNDKPCGMSPLYYSYKGPQ